jgi:hypothetical protein
MMSIEGKFLFRNEIGVLEEVQIPMTRQRLKIIAVIVLIVEILALILVTFGLYIRFSGEGNPAGTTYISIGGVLVLGGGIIMFFVSRQMANRNNNK